MNSLESISTTNDAEKFKWTTAVKVLEKEQIRIIPFPLPKSAILSGIQFTLEFNPEVLNFIRLLPSEGIGEHNFNLNKVKEGYII